MAATGSSLTPPGPQPAPGYFDRWERGTRVLARVACLALLAGYLLPTVSLDATGALRLGAPWAGRSNRYSSESAASHLIAPVVLALLAWLTAAHGSLRARGERLVGLIVLASLFLPTRRERPVMVRDWESANFHIDWTLACLLTALGLTLCWTRAHAGAGMWILIVGTALCLFAIPATLLPASLLFHPLTVALPLLVPMYVSGKTGGERWARRLTVGTVLVYFLSDVVVEYAFLRSSPRVSPHTFSLAGQVSDALTALRLALGPCGLCILLGVALFAWIAGARWDRRPNLEKTFG